MALRVPGIQKTLYALEEMLGEAREEKSLDFEVIVFPGSRAITPVVSLTSP